MDEDYGIELEQAVEEYLDFVERPRTDMPYEARQRIKLERLKEMRAALERRKAVADAT